MRRGVVRPEFYGLQRMLEGLLVSAPRRVDRRDIFMSQEVVRVHPQNVGELLQRPGPVLPSSLEDGQGEIVAHVKVFRIGLGGELQPPQRLVVVPELLEDGG